jgi:mannosyltransferase OCH1-like enzyme
MKTWKKYIPNDYKIVVLNYYNIRKYLDFKTLKQIICKQMSLAIQADAIRVAILQKYGGIWMDADTIITNSKFMNMFNGSDLIMFGHKCQRIGFIYAKTNSTILKIWLDNIIEKIRIYKYRFFLKIIFPIKNFKDSFKKLLKWNYLGNMILEKIIKNASQKDFKSINANDKYIFLEDFFSKGSAYKRYNDFYFTSRDPEPILSKCNGIILLHNSWTPHKYKKMSSEEFILQNILLSRLLYRLLI